MGGCQWAGSLVTLGLALLWSGALTPGPPPPADADVAALSTLFHAGIGVAKHLSVASRGELKRDRNTFFWSLFSDQFGSNPNTPYMWAALPLFGVLLPSPMWSLGKRDAVVLLSRLPPDIEYFSFTSFALWAPRRGLTFSSLGDSVNNLNINNTHDGLFAHVLTSNAKTYELVVKLLVESGLPEPAINLTPVPSDVGLFDDWTHFETVLRLFRFRNQTEGDAFLHSHQPVYYITGGHDDDSAFPTRGYKTREHPENVREASLEPAFAVFGDTTMAKVGIKLHRSLGALQPSVFAPLMIIGQECLRTGTECLGDCPDATYFGPYVLPDSDRIKMLTLSDHEIHVVTLVNHRLLNASEYSSIAILKSKEEAISKTRMKIRATSLGVTSFEFPSDAEFVSWAFTRNPLHCDALAGTVDGCSVVEDTHVARDAFLTYCERLYLSPVTATGPNWSDVLPARLYRIKLDEIPDSRLAFSRIRLPPPALFETFWDRDEPLRFLHIIKTGGESLEAHLALHSTPRLDFSTCRQAAMSSGHRGNTSASGGCMAAGAVVSAALCGLNCECCAADVRAPEGGFHGTLLRSPRSHVLSQFSHCHIAHHGTWGRAAEDVQLFLAETLLHGTEALCGSYCTGADTANNADWYGALEERLSAADSVAEKGRTVRVIPLHNTQSHALTCSKSRGSLGHHFRVLDEGVDVLEPPLDATLEAMNRFEWVGITDLYEPSLCLLHYQANGTLPASCDCDSLEHKGAKLGHWVETRSQKHDPSTLPEDVLAKIDGHTYVDAKLFAAALRLLLGRLQTVEERTGVSVLKCIDWYGLYTSTSYIPGLWTGVDGLLIE